MKTAAIFLALCAAVHAAVPAMWVKDARGRVPLRIDSVDARIRIVGEIAETTLTLRFRNETGRMQEGEFVMPLPGGATVSGYALEVNGKLRPGVAVPKQQARHAYESIKRSLLDPGLVEREEGNAYRARVFPIPAQGTKLVRISYIEALSVQGGMLRYSLPVDYPGAIDRFTCTVRCPEDADARIKTENEDLDFRPAGRGEFKTSAEKAELEGRIDVVLPLLRGDWLFVGESDAGTPDGANYFLVSLARPKTAGEARRHPAVINIVWDASDSRREQNHDHEFALLDAYFKRLAAGGPGAPILVTLQYLRNTLQNAGEFSVENGNWKKLRRVLENTFYDGSADYSRIAPFQHKADATLLFTDASSPDDTGPLLVNTGQTTFIFHRGGEGEFRNHTDPAFGESINLERTALPEALSLLTLTRYRIASNIGGNAEILSVRTGRRGRVLLVGRASRGPVRRIDIAWRNANGKEIVPRISSAKTVPGGLLRRFWAQEKLLAMECGGAGKKRIAAHCRRFGLVGEFTSLVVLEKFSDYVRFGIPPPEPELRERWEEARKFRTGNSSHARGFTETVRWKWRQRLAWYKHRFTWFSEIHRRQFRQTGVWLRAVHAVFRPPDLDAHAFGVIEAWYRKCERLLADEQEIATRKSWQLWRSREKKLVEEWKTFGDMPVKRAKDQALAVSVRGLVKTPGTYRTDKDLTLEQALRLAGGPNPVGKLEYVSLYRNAEAWSYNLLSKQFKDVPLAPGDMVVVEPRPYSGCFDPFCFGPSPSEMPPVSKPTRRLGSGEGDPLAGGAGAPFRVPKGAKVIVLPPPEPKHADHRIFEEFDRSLARAVDPAACYRKLKADLARPRDFHIEAARILRKHGHDALAIQALSNIIEGRPHNAATRRDFAYCLGQCGLLDAALGILRSLRPAGSEGFRNRLDIIRYTKRRHPRYDPFDDYQNLIADIRFADPNIDTNLVMPALVARNACPELADPAAPNHPSLQCRENLASDIRCVIYSSNSKAIVVPEMHEPSGEIAGGGRVTGQGGRFFSCSGIEEYALKRAMPGVYTLNCRVSCRATLQIAIHTHWGTPEQNTRWTTVRLEPNTKPRPVARIAVSLPGKASSTR